MKLVVFGPFKRLGALTANGNIVDLNLAYTEYLKDSGASRPQARAAVALPVNLQDFITEGESALNAAKEAMSYAQKNSTLTIDRTGVKIWAPLPSAGTRIVCAGANFADHGAGAKAAREGRAVTQADIDQVMQELKEGKYAQWGFWKMAQCVIGPDEPMIYPSRTRHLDYEVELIAVIGERCKNLPDGEAAMSTVFGYTGFIDWSIRDDGFKTTPADWALFKNFDTSASLGPCIVTKDEIPDPYGVMLELRVNGELRQKAKTSLMMRKFPAWMAHISRDFTLNPGDMFASGTGVGTAMDSTPKAKDGTVATDLFLKIGDVVEVTVEHIGSMKNTIVAES